LWALDLIHALQQQALLGLVPAAEAKERVAELGVKYQLVTDETSMLVLDDQGFAENGVERLNQARTGIEHTAQGAGTGQGSSAPISSGSGSANGAASGEDRDLYGGALDPLSLGLTLLWLFGRRRREASR
jgi:Ca-activated chloride channel family protein